MYKWYKKHFPKELRSWEAGSEFLEIMGMALPKKYKICAGKAAREK
jgi:hypothetical protein